MILKKNFLFFFKDGNEDSQTKCSRARGRNESVGEAANEKKERKRGPSTI